MRRRISERIEIDFGDNNPEWRRIRNTPEMTAYLEHIGVETVSRSNSDLHAAQAKRRQPQEDGYDHHISHGSRARLTIFPDTPRAMAHEAVNQTILKNLPVGEIKGARPPDHEVPAELARRSNQAQTETRLRANSDAQGNPIHNLDRP
jgi:hypothetical protein